MNGASWCDAGRSHPAFAGPARRHAGFDSYAGRASRNALLLRTGRDAQAFEAGIDGMLSRPGAARSPDSLYAGRVSMHYARMPGNWSAGVF